MRWNARAKSSNDLFAFFLHGIKGSLSKYKVICTQGTDRLRRSMPRVWKSTLFLGCFHCNRLSFLPCLSRFPTGLLRGPTTLFQVWSLTQFYSVDFWQSRIGVKKCVFNKRTIKVCVTSAPSAPHLTVSLYLCSSGSNARGESRVQDRDEGVAGRNGRE